jgi:hypothetical protein
MAEKNKKKPRKIRPEWRIDTEALHRDMEKDRQEMQLNNKQAEINERISYEAMHRYINT